MKRTANEWLPVPKRNAGDRPANPARAKGAGRAEKEVTEE